MSDKKPKPGQLTKKIGDTEYTFQRVMNSAWLDITTRCRDRQGNTSEKLVIQAALEHIVVNPRMEMDDFPTYEDMMEVVQEALQFQTGVSFR